MEMDLSWTMDERNEAIKKYNEMLNWTRSLSEEQVHAVMDMGYLNSSLKGYMISAARNAGLDREQTQELLNGLRLALSEQNAADAEKVYIDF